MVRKNTFCGLVWEVWQSPRYATLILFQEWMCCPAGAGGECRASSLQLLQGQLQLQSVASLHKDSPALGYPYPVMNKGVCVEI